MTSEQLIEEGRKLQRPCVFLRPQGAGRVEITPTLPKGGGTKLYAHPASVLPPIDAVFARGSDAVEAWIRSHGWERFDRYNNNFKDKAIVDVYDDIHRQEYPLYFDSDIYAMLGGWHGPGQDDG